MARTGDRATAHPDERAYRRSASTIGWQVMAVCAALVVIGGAVILAFVFWQTTPGEASKPPQPGEVEVRLDPGELLLAVGLLATGAVLCAGLAARLIARRAVHPLDEAFRVQRRFVADVSHELRTPLAVLDARAQQLAALTPVDDSRRVVLAELRGDVRIMSEVIDALLDQASGATRGSGTADLRETIAEVVQDLGTVAGSAGVAVVGSGPSLTVKMPAVSLRRCLVALADNAIAHSPAGETVTLVAALRDGRAVVRVQDAGTGIRGIAPSAVFEREAQGAPPARPADGPRTSRGIGLALVRELCEAHGGAVRLIEPGPGGTVFEIELPLAQAGKG